MDQNGRIEAMKTAFDAWSVACDNLLQAKKEYDVARATYKNTVLEMSVLRQEEINQFMEEWKTDWEKKWGIKWEQLAIPEGETEPPNRNFKNIEKLVKKQDEWQAEGEYESEMFRAIIKKLETIRCVEWEFRY